MQAYAQFFWFISHSQLCFFERKVSLLQRENILAISFGRDIDWSGFCFCLSLHLIWPFNFWPSKYQVLWINFPLAFVHAFTYCFHLWFKVFYHSWWNYFLSHYSNCFMDYSWILCRLLNKDAGFIFSFCRIRFIFFSFLPLVLLSGQGNGIWRC